jgi:hypothetical protein
MSKDYLALFRSYLSAFNSHSLPAVKQFLAPNCSVTFQDKQLNDSREKMLLTLPPRWAKLGRDIEIKEIRAIEDGVWVILRSWDENRDAEVEYHYDLEGLQIRHDIKGFKPIVEEVGK